MAQKTYVYQGRRLKEISINLFQLQHYCSSRRRDRCVHVARHDNIARLTLHTGPEVVNEAVRVLQVISDASNEFKLNLSPHAFGGAAIDSTGHPLPESTLKACQEADAILMGEPPFTCLAKGGDYLCAAC